MIKKKQLIWLLCGLWCVFVLAGCQNKYNEEQKAFCTVENADGKKLTLTQKPQRIVVLSPSFLEILQELKVPLVGRPTSKLVNAEIAYQKVKEVGPVYHINTEAVLALQPNLVIGMQGINDKFAPFFANNSTPFLLLKMKTYQDTENAILTLGEVTGKKDLAVKLRSEMQKQIKQVQNNFHPQASIKTVAILHVTSRGLQLQTKYSIAGSVINLLHLQNIASQKRETENIPYNFEALVQSNPDVIFITTMGDEAKMHAEVKHLMQENKAWQQLTAVQKKRIYYLPQKYFLLSPGLQYPEAVRIMAQDIMQIAP